MPIVIAEIHSGNEIQHSDVEEIEESRGGNQVVGKKGKTCT
jgi:hypothetical protein